MADFKRLLSEAHKRGMRVIIDRVSEYTSDLNPWFVASRDPKSPYRDWYYWSTDKDTNVWGFPPSIWGQAAWYKSVKGYYFSMFGQDIPWLNLTNPAVSAEVYKICRFWLRDVGVDGFRVDSATSLLPEGCKLYHTPGTHAWLKGFFTSYKSFNPNAFTVGEVWKEPASILASYTGDQVDTTFEFNIAGAIIDSVRQGRSSGINAALL